MSNNIKLIFESWRKHLSEQEDEEAFEKLVQYFKDSAGMDLNAITHAAEMAKSIGGETSKKFYKFLLKEKYIVQEQIYKYERYYHEYDPGALESAGPVRDTFNEFTDRLKSLNRALSITYNAKEIKHV